MKSHDDNTMENMTINKHKKTTIHLHVRGFNKNLIQRVFMYVCMIN